MPIIEKMSTRNDPEFLKKLFAIYEGLPRPLQLARDGFKESIKNPDVILTTLRLNDDKGEIIGFTKGGPLESYKIRPEI